MQKATAELLAPLDSDAGICDAARVSFHKIAANFSPEQNFGLMRYLKTHKHWSPFGHSREVFALDIGVSEWAHFLTYANLAGFTWHKATNRIFLAGSIWAWYENLSFLSPDIADVIRGWFRSSDKYQLCSHLLFREPTAVINSKAAEYVMPRDVREFADIVSVSFRVKAPVFVARQAVKHQIHLCWNEVSRRYVDEAPEYFVPERWRARPDKGIKQGSGGYVELSPELQHRADNYTNDASDLYNAMLSENVAPEMARIVLPLSMVTEWIWTGSVRAFRRVCDERLASSAQKEIRELAEDFDSALKQRVPVIWKSLSEEPPHVEMG